MRALWGDAGGRVALANLISQAGKTRSRSRIGAGGAPGEPRVNKAPPASVGGVYDLTPARTHANYGGNSRSSCQTTVVGHRS